MMAAACMLLVACAQQAQLRAPSARETAAIEANNHAEASFRRGDFESAAKHYREAMRISRSLEAVDAIASNAVNLSIVFQRLGKSAEAQLSLSSVLDQDALVFPPLRLAQAALRRSILKLEERQYESAAQWVEKAADQCVAPSCTLQAALYNVKAQIALENGRADVATRYAQLALNASRDTDDQVETANAFRLLGNSALRVGNAGAALEPLAQALAIDREIGLPPKIYLDLVSLGRANTLIGKLDLARKFYERALVVSEASQDNQGASAVRALLDTAGGQK